MRFWRGFLVVVALGLASPLSGCTALLGDFSSTESTPKEAGAPASGADATAGDDAGNASDGSAVADVGAGDDAPLATGCNPGHMACAAGCVSASDIHTCGDCNNDCTTLSHVASTGLACTNGVCTFTCSPGYDHCPPSSAPGCETNLSAVAHCGSCTNVCGDETPFCAPSGSTYACSNGCPAGTVGCSGSCSDPMSDNNNCGGCGKACTGGMTCQSGTCACPAPLTNCGGTCFETDGDPTHCGASCTVCPVPGNGGTATCSQGACGVSCAAGFSACSTDRRAPVRLQHEHGRDPLRRRLHRLRHRVHLLGGQVPVRRGPPGLRRRLREHRDGRQQLRQLRKRLSRQRPRLQGKRLLVPRHALRHHDVRVRRFVLQGRRHLDLLLEARGQARRRRQRALTHFTLRCTARHGVQPPG